MRKWIKGKAKYLRTMLAERVVQKSVLKRTADILEKLGIAGLALGIFQMRIDGAIWGGVFLGLSYIFSIWEAKK